jgi:hypothetical protein
MQLIDSVGFSVRTIDRQAVRVAHSTVFLWTHFGFPVDYFANFQVAGANT